jgi:hypothetical protein
LSSRSYRPQFFRVTLAALVGFSVIGATSDARADRNEVEAQLAIGAGAAWMRSLPTFATDSLLTNARDLGRGSVRSSRGITLYGSHFDVALTIRDRWSIPLLGGGVYGAVGPHDGILTTLDGSMVRLRPWTTVRADMLLPGVAYRLKKRRWMFTFGGRIGVGYTSLKGSVASAAEVDELDIEKATVFLQSEIEACRRLDPTTRLCVQVAPRLYDYQLLNGGTLSLRIEWGK